MTSDLTPSWLKGVHLSPFFTPLDACRVLFLASIMPRPSPHPPNNDNALMPLSNTRDNTNNCHSQYVIKCRTVTQQAVNFLDRRASQLSMYAMPKFAHYTQINCWRQLLSSISLSISYSASIRLPEISQNICFICQKRNKSGSTAAKIQKPRWRMVFTITSTHEMWNKNLNIFQDGDSFGATKFKDFSSTFSRHIPAFYHIILNGSSMI